MKNDWIMIELITSSSLSLEVMSCLMQDNVVTNNKQNTFSFSLFLFQYDTRFFHLNNVVNDLGQKSSRSSEITLLHFLSCTLQSVMDYNLSVIYPTLAPGHHSLSFTFVFPKTRHDLRNRTSNWQPHFSGVKLNTASVYSPYLQENIIPPLSNTSYLSFFLSLLRALLQTERSQ